MHDEDRAPPMALQPHTRWYHGSPDQLTTLREGSTVTPIRELAKAFSHKPRTLNVDIPDGAPLGERVVRISHDGTRPGYLHLVDVSDPAEDLRQHPGSGFALGEEMLTTRDLPLGFIEELPPAPEYEHSETIAGGRARGAHATTSGSHVSD